MTRKTTKPRCSNGTNCVAYPTLGEPSKLSLGNPGPRCFACEERSASSTLKRAVAKKTKGTGSQEANVPRRGKTNRPMEHADVGVTSIVLERRRQSVLTCQRGLHSAKASGDERLVRRWLRSLRDAEQRMAWAKADFERVRRAAG